MFITDPPYMKGESMKVDYWGLGLLAVGLGALSDRTRQRSTGQLVR